MLDIGSPKELMGLLISPPECQNIVRTIFTLKEVGALFLTANGKVSIEDGDLSYLGHVVAKLPIEIHLGKLIMLGNQHVFVWRSLCLHYFFRLHL